MVTKEVEYFDKLVVKKMVDLELYPTTGKLRKHYKIQFILFLALDFQIVCP